ncbi:hypothetical protein RDABS01_004123 [Bienertia sinuspersici]
MENQKTVNIAKPMWRRRALSLNPISVLFPSTFSFFPEPQIQSSSSSSPTCFQTPNTPLTPEQKTNLETTLHHSLSSSNTDEAWKSFRSLTNNSVFPSKSLTNSLITHLSSLSDVHNLKRAFASVVFLAEKIQTC